MVRKIVVGVAFLFLFLESPAQEIVPDGYFLNDSMMIGQEIDYSLYIKYPKSRDIVFPDSTHNYAPFEYYSRRYFATKEDSVFAYDSVVYSLASFEIDSIQYLQLPIYMVVGKDSVEVLPPIDSIYLVEMITQLPDSLVLKENTSFRTVGQEFNYPYLMIGLGILLVIVVILFLVFGKTIRKKFRLYRLRKEYEKFTLAFDRGVSKMKKDREIKNIESVVVVWKKYMEKLEDKPFTKYTTREILNSGYDQSLKDSLKNIDRSIYGRRDDEAMHKNFETLEDFTQERYNNKVQEVNNG